MVACYSLSGNFSTPCTKSYSFKLPKQPIKIMCIDYKTTKLTLILFQD